MNKYFIDCGGNNGCSVKKFRNEFDPNCEIKIYTFEANPLFFDCYKDFKNHELIKKIVWIEDSLIDFYIHNCPSGVGSTVFKNKVNYDANNNQTYKTHKSESIKFSRWLKEMFKPDDKIVLKMDIEGAEYPVLKQMLEENTIKLIRKLFIEWHWNYIGMTIDEHNLIADEVKKHLSIENWDAMSYFNR